MRKSTVGTFAFVLLFLCSFSSWAQQSVSISSSELDTNTNLLSITGEMGGFEHTPGHSGCFVNLRFTNGASIEQATIEHEPTEFDGVVFSTPNPSCDGVTSPTLLVRKIALDSSAGTFELEVLACAVTITDAAEDFTISTGLFNNVTEEEAFATAPLMGFAESEEEDPVVFEFKKAYLSMKRKKGHAFVKAEFSEFDILAGDEVKVLMGLQNAETGESELDEVVLSKRKEFRGKAFAYYRARRWVRCKKSDGPKVVLRGVFVYRNKAGTNRIFANAKVCNFDYKNSQKEDWNMVLGLSNDLGEGGSASTGLSHFRKVKRKWRRW